MNTKSTQHPPSAIQVLSHALLHAHVDGLSTDQEIAEEITDIWLPVFRSEKNFAMALEVLKLSHENGIASGVCERYLDVMKGMK